MSRNNSEKKPSKLAIWRLKHVKVATSSLSRMRGEAVTAVVTTFVIAIALLLPTLLFWAHAGLDAVLQEFRNSARVTVYFDQGTSQDRAFAVRDHLLANYPLETVEYISASEALRSFSETVGFGRALAEIADNPLPPSLLVTMQALASASAETLREYLLTVPEVNLVQADLDWVDRLEAITAFLRALGLVLSLIAVLGLIVLIGHSIRTAIDRRRDEIRVTKLVGGTDRYCARPFLYDGFFYGLFGAFGALISVYLLHLTISSSLSPILTQYEIGAFASALPLTYALGLVLAGSLLGWLAALLTAFYYIRKIDF